MARRAARIDENQPEIVKALRDIYCKVEILSTVGQGVPDLLVGDRGVNYLLEVKDGNKSPSRRKLTDDEQTWHDEWRGQVTVVNSAEEAVSFILEQRVKNGTTANHQIRNT